MSAEIQNRRIPFDRSVSRTPNSNLIRSMNSRMQKHTNRALVISLSLHIAAMLAVSPFLVSHFNAEKEIISAEILKPEPEKQVRKRVLPPRTPLVPKVDEASTSSPASPTYTPEVSVPKAPVHADVVLEVVTHADTPQSDTPGPISNASFGDEGAMAGPVVIEGQRGNSVSRFRSDGSGLENQFAHASSAADVGLAAFDSVDAGLGIFGIDVMPGHGLIGQVYVPDGPIEYMPNFARLTPVYTFVTPNLDVSVREYTLGFPTPELQTVIENFAIRFRGELAVDTPGTYTFWLLSDDGSKLYINDALVVNNDGIHGVTSSRGRKDLSENTRVSWEFNRHTVEMGKRGSIKLDAGTHPFEVEYFQGPRYELALQWFYQPPNGRRQIVPPDVIYRPGKPRIPDALKKLQQRLKNIEDVGNSK